jgi:hypothetical protein
MNGFFYQPTQAAAVVDFEKEVYFLPDAANSSRFQAQGHLLFRPASRILLAAPHGGFDLATDNIALEICRLNPRLSCLIAQSFRSESPSPIRHNVNRPTTRQSDDCSQPNQKSQRVFETWMEKISRQGPLLYIEIHGNNRPASASGIEIAHGGFDPHALKDIFTDPKFLIEGIDPIYFHAKQNKECGSMAMVPKSIHIELPYQYRKSVTAQQAIAQSLNDHIKRLLRASNFHY